MQDNVRYYAPIAPSHPPRPVSYDVAELKDTLSEHLALRQEEPSFCSQLLHLSKAVELRSLQKLITTTSTSVQGTLPWKPIPEDDKASAHLPCSQEFRTRPTSGMDECLAYADLDFVPSPRVPLILGRCFLKTSRALIDVHKGELTLRIGSEAITYNLDQTSRYSANYHTHDVQQDWTSLIWLVRNTLKKSLFFTDIIASGNSTPYYDPIVAEHLHLP
ncbi:hypothetical protein Tco_0425950 [Tanacetum coccineum]